MQHNYIFVGLTPTERSLLQSLFALDQEGGDELVPVRRPEDAHLIVVNGDDHAVVARLRAANPRALVVLVGEPVGHPVGGLPILHRPLRVGAAAEVLSRLEWPAHLLDSGRHGSASQDTSGRLTESSPADLTTSSPTLAPTTRSMRLPPHAATPTDSAPRAVSARAAWLHSEPAPVAPPLRHGSAAAGLSEPSAVPFSAVDAINDADVMVVVGAVGQRSSTLARGLRRLGFRVRLVEGAQAAQAAFTQGPVSFVFLDQGSLGDELLHLARWLNARRTAADGAPHVVVVARRRSVFEHLRAHGGLPVDGGAVGPRAAAGLLQAARPAPDALFSGLRRAPPRGLAPQGTGRHGLLRQIRFLRRSWLRTTLLFLWRHAPHSGR